MAHLLTMRHLFILDPLDRLHVEGDIDRSSMRLGAAATSSDLRGRPGSAAASPYRARATTAGASEWWSTEGSRDVPLCDYGAVWMRKDPPLDDAYLFATLLMSRTEGPVMVNDPAALRDQNEKLFALEFPELCPTTLVSRRIDQLLAFRDDLGGEMIVKPLDGNGGRDVFHLTPGDRNARAIIEAGTSSGQRLLLAQEYVPSVRAGDKRIILIEGERRRQLRVPAGRRAPTCTSAAARSRQSSPRATARSARALARASELG